MEEVSVIVMIYNGKLTDILATIKSVIWQKNIVIKLIINDDCSNSSYIPEIKEYLDSVEYTDYLCIEGKENKGTVWCLNNALKYVHTKYVKPIGQGDLFYNENALYNMIEYMKKSNKEVAFGKIVGYNKEQEIHVVETYSPLNIVPYLNNNYKEITREFFLYSSAPCGACQFFKTETIKKYVSQMVGHVRYCEDNFIGLWMLDGGKIGYYRDFFVWYEVGSGISWGKESSSINRFKIDQKDCFEYFNRIRPNKITRTAARVNRTNIIKNNTWRRIKKILVCPSVIAFKQKCRKNLKATREQLNISQVDNSFIVECFENN